MNTPERIQAYTEVLKRHCIDPEDDSYSGGEDAAAYLNGEATIERFCVVTQGGDFLYAYAHDATLEEARARAMENIDDSLFAETPLEIVDLDTGDTFTPDWSTIQWQAESKEVA